MSASSGSEWGPRSLGLLLSCREPGIRTSQDRGRNGCVIPDSAGTGSSRFGKVFARNQAKGEQKCFVFLQLSTGSEDCTGVWLLERFTLSC